MILSRLTLAQKLLLLLLFISFLGYPLFLKFFFLSLYKIIISMAILLVILSLLINNQRINKIYYPFIFLYIGYYFAIIFASYTYIEFNTISVMLNQLTKILFLLFLLLIIDKNFINTSLRLYTKLFFLLSIMAIFFWLLVFFNLVQPIGNITLSNQLLSNAQSRMNYGIGFLWSVIPINGYYFSRLQSYSDEPGTFAFGLIPAIFYSYYYMKKYIFYVLLIALILTLSVGIIGMFILFVFVFNTKKIWLYLLFLVPFFLLIVPSDVLHFIINYIIDKFSSDGNEVTSVGIRAEGYSLMVEKLQEYPFGLGLIGNTYIDASIASSFPIAFLKGGIIGGVLYLFAFTIPLIYSFLFIKSSSKFYKTIGSIYFVFYFSSLSRGEMDITFFHMWIIGMMLFVISKNHQNKKEIN